MKQLILLYMFQLINAEDIQQLADLKDKVVTFINVAEFDLEKSAEHCTKRLIVNSLHNYVSGPDTMLKAILKSHYSLLSKVLA